MPDEGLWAYGVTAAGRAPEGLTGVGGAPVGATEHEGLALLVSAVPLAEFGEAPLRRNLNDLAWLERVARAHEAVLDRALAATTVVPLRLCTIFADAGGARRMLAERADVLHQALATLDGREEWSVKLLVDRAAGSAATDEPESGAAYLMRRRAERDRRAAAGDAAAALAADIHARLRDWAGAGVVRPAQNRELSGHTGEMVLNGAYLVERARADELRALVEDLRARHRDSGARIELSGPFPAYNFASGE
jgi:Gas vesicle synthesis protein GvpL/GvpF